MFNVVILGGVESGEFNAQVVSDHGYGAKCRQMLQMLGTLSVVHCSMFKDQCFMLNQGRTWARLLFIWR